MNTLQRIRYESELKRLCKAQRELGTIRQSIDNILFTDDISRAIASAESELEKFIQGLQKELFAAIPNSEGGAE